MPKRNTISVYEHVPIRVGDVFGKGSRVEFTQRHLDALEKFHGDGSPYFSLISRGVKFNEHVGVLHVGDLLIEVLPKADKVGNDDDKEWRDILIGMLKAVGAFKISAPSSSSLNLKANYLLDLYFELFVNEVEYLINRGLIKKYRKTEGNQLTLKGSLNFGKHIAKNLIHQERFYINYTTYDQEHRIHEVLYKALGLLSRINTNNTLNGRIGALKLNFPEQKDVSVTDATFEKLTLDRKSQPYGSVLDIAKLLLLNYHPDVSKGENNVLAIMFNMNALWEQFVYVSLRNKAVDGWQVSAQIQENFWKPESGYSSYMKPDIVLNKALGIDKFQSIVLDTKWKNLYGKNPSPSDLRQLYVYHEYFNADKVALVYPGKISINNGRFNLKTRFRSKDDIQEVEKQCSVIELPTNKDIPTWQNEIATYIFSNYIGGEPLKTLKQ